MKKLEGKVAIVTGASKGIGAGIAKGLADAGAKVVVNYASSREGADTVVSAIQTKGGTAIAVQGDISRSEDVEQLFDAAVETYGQVNILVNNAGIYEFGPVEGITREAFQRHYEVNVLGPILAIQQAVRVFGGKGGSIINIGSGATTLLGANTALYTGTKGAIDVMTAVLSKELGPKGIRVNSINPGATETEGAHAAGAIGTEWQQHLIASTPLRRFGQPDDIAPLAVFLASDDAAWITGEVILASGGLR
jgi:3-oxoacyl-[acyl-carrier protein] reductase